MVSTPFGQIPLLTLAIALVALAGLIIAVTVAVPARRVDVRARLRAEATGESTLTRGTRGTTALISRAVARAGRTRAWSHALDRAGIRWTLPEFLLLLGAAALVGLAVGLFLNGWVLGLLLAVLVVVAAVLVVAVLADRRKRQFADQLDDLSQLLATNLRAGHSLVQSMSSLAVDMDEPARGELSRAVNQVRVGRDLGEALEETANRMASEDFTWVAQAIAIHRQVGGNLADVLDTVSQTIRERNQVRRQVHALSAEGRMSAVILMALPIGVGLLLSFVNPLYFQTFTQSLLGWVMLALCAVLMTIGGLWLRVLTRVEY